jgi:hypothetical protein
LFVLQIRAAMQPIACIAEFATAMPSVPRQVALMKSDGVWILAFNLDRGRGNSWFFSPD